MDAVAAIKAGRRAAEKLMLDRVKILRGGGEPVFNPDTGQYEDPAVTIWEGPAKFATTGGQAKTPVAGQVQFTVQTTELHLPISSPGVAVNDRAVIVSAPLEPDRAGEVHRITAIPRKTYSTAKRLQVEQLI